MQIYYFLDISRGLKSKWVILAEIKVVRTMCLVEVLREDPFLAFSSFSGLPAFFGWGPLPPSSKPVM